MQKKSLFKGASLKLLTPYLVLLGALCLTVITALELHRKEVRDLEFAFQEKVKELKQTLQTRMKAQEQILLGAAGLFAASTAVDRDEFQKYIAQLNLDENFHGHLGVGYSAWIKPAELSATIEEVRAEGFPQFTIHPVLPPRKDYSIILYIEPFSGRNLAAFGYDMYTETVRRTAMNYAVEKNTAGLSARVPLVQENDGPVQPGMLMYLPIYKKNNPLNTSDERWQALQGFVYSPFRINDFMKGIFRAEDSFLSFKVYSGVIRSRDKLLYNSSENADFVQARFQRLDKLELYGQIWSIEVINTPLLIAERKSHLVKIVLIVGAIFSFFLFLLLKMFSGQRERALKLAEAMTVDINKKNRELKHSEERFQLALESSAMGVWSLQLSDNNVQWDASMRALFGLHENTTLTNYESFLALVHHEDRQRVFEEIAQAIEGQQGYDTEYRVVWADHSIHYLASRAKIIYENAAAVSMIGTCWDVTERKRLDKVKTEFVSTVSHELRTPLTAITGALGLAVGGALCELPEKAQQILGIAYKNAQRLKLLINDLLDMDKLLDGKLDFHCEPQTLMPLIERAVAENQSYADQYGVRFVVAPASIAPRVDVEDIRLLQVLANFLSNGAKFSKPDTDVLITLTQNDGFVRISVIDTGVGLAEESKAHIFEKFYQADSSDTRKKGGTGLGLAITKEIVERMGGRVGFVSALGEGSTFYAEFPVVV
ncbi:MAG TPA: CHASE domain-containing protein [Cellvibrio sp.]|nr:CHASE domain-containing protein [Cellvibrio sp.]